jgi:hypothetical protein
MEINSMLENEKLLPPKRQGMACVAVIDCSPHAKAKAQACQMCLSCIEKIGLASFGKKGILATAKMLSQDTTMHRVAALDLMESILSKMNGDILRLARICGPNLSDKGRQLLEERWYKSHSKDSAHIISSGSPNTRPPPGSPQKVTSFGFHKEDKQSDIIDELPRLTLRAFGKEPPRNSPRKLIPEDLPSNEAFSFSATMLASPTNADSEFALSSSGTAFRSFSAADIEPSGAAAALRARLLKIREKTKLPESDTSINNGDFMPHLLADSPELMDFDTILDNIHNLLNKSPPIPEYDSCMETCIFALKVVHSTLSKQVNSSLGLSENNLEYLRGRLLQNVNQVVGLLRR